jgi:hypothetical protein
MVQEQRPIEGPAPLAPLAVRGTRQRTDVADDEPTLILGNRIHHWWMATPAKGDALEEQPVTVVLDIYGSQICRERSKALSDGPLPSSGSAMALYAIKLVALRSHGDDFRRWGKGVL